MTQDCTHPFDEKLISGFLDDALPQMKAQKVRLHLEDCGTCRTLYEELRTLRETARSTRFQSPGHTDWPELPTTRPSLWSRSLGWVLLVAWFAVTGGLALWRFVSQTGDPMEIFLALGLPGGLLLLFVSVLIDRLRELKTDRYRGVHR